MKTLLLVRHAKSDWRAGLADHDRPLNERGLHDAPRMGAELRERGTTPDAIIASTATRARTTAALMAAAMGVADDAVTSDRALYNAAPDALLEAVRTHDDADETLMLVAHDPGMSALAALFTDTPIELPTCTVVEVTLDIDRWHDAAPAAGRVVRVDTPR